MAEVSVQPMISITYDPEGEQMTWSTEGFDPMGAMGMMVDVLCSMYAKWVEDPMRPALPNEARVCLEMVADKVAMTYRPETAQLLEIQGMMVTSLIGFIKLKQSPDFDPYLAVMGAFMLGVE